MLAGPRVSPATSGRASPVWTGRGERERASLTGPPYRGRRRLVENSPLIRHPSNISGGGLVAVTGEEEAAQHAVMNSETNQFLREVVEQATAGEGVGWLKLTRLRKLMEEEHYRTLVLSKLQSSIEPKVAPDDHIQDVVRVLIRSETLLCNQYSPQCLTKSVYKGVLKVLLAVITGLEVSLNNFGVGGLSSACRLLEIAHTHYWSKDLLDNVHPGLSGPSSTDASQYGSRDNLDGNPDR